MLASQTDGQGSVSAGAWVFMTSVGRVIYFKEPGEEAWGSDASLKLSTEGGACCTTTGTDGRGHWKLPHPLCWICKGWTWRVNKREQEGEARRDRVIEVSAPPKHFSLVEMKNEKGFLQTDHLLIQQHNFQQFWYFSFLWKYRMYLLKVYFNSKVLYYFQELHPSATSSLPSCSQFVTSHIIVSAL